MPATSPANTPEAADHLKAIGTAIRTERKALKVSAVAAAEAAGVSRVTLHRIERGEPAVTMGAYLNAAAALGLKMALIPAAGSATQATHEGWIPARIRPEDYPQLRQLAWQVQPHEDLTPAEAWDIYGRNWRHIDEQALSPGERHLVKALGQAFGGGRSRDTDRV